jgi:hypothetical protein
MTVSALVRLGFGPKQQFLLALVALNVVLRDYDKGRACVLEGALDDGQ